MCGEFLVMRALPLDPALRGRGAAMSAQQAFGLAFPWKCSKWHALALAPALALIFKGFYHCRSPPLPCCMHACAGRLRGLQGMCGQGRMSPFPDLLISDALLPAWSPCLQVGCGACRECVSQRSTPAATGWAARCSCWPPPPLKDDTWSTLFLVRVDRSWIKSWPTQSRCADQSYEYNETPFTLN